MKAWMRKVFRHGRWLAVAACGWAVACPAASLDQAYRITRWETDDGLPENSATAMVQAPDGYLWFGTFNGLVRFDGVDFDVFNPSNTPELVGAGIVNLHLDKSGRLWISTSRGLVSLKERRWKRHGLNTSWTNRIVRTFAENAAGVLCATSFDGAVCRIDGEEIIELPPPTVARGQRGYVDPVGTLWAVSAEFFGHWDGRRWVAAETAVEMTNAFRCSTTARDGNLWILQQSRLLKVQAGRILQSVPLTRNPHNLWDLFEDEEGVLWASSYQAGLFRISQSGAVEQYTMTNGLSYDALRFVFQDHERNLWIGSSGGGLMRLRPRTFLTFDTEGLLRARVVKSVWEERPGAVLLGSYGGGVIRLDESGMSVVGAEAIQRDTFVQCVLVDRKHRTWIGSYGQTADYEHALVVLENGGHRLVPARESGGVAISSLFEDSTGRIWIGGNEAIACFDAGGFRRVDQEAGGPIRSARCFAENPVDGSIWAANSYGLFRRVGERFQGVTGPGGRSLEEPSCLKFERDGTLWVGTRFAGLMRWRNATWAALPASAGLPSGMIGSILDDGLGYFWIGSNRGVTRVAKAACQAVIEGRQAQLGGQTFTVNDGLGSVECTTGVQPNATVDSQGRLWFTTLKGVAMVDPKMFRPETNCPPVVFESSSYVGRDGVRHELQLDGSAVEFPAGSSRLELKYFAPSFSDPQRVRFAHQLTRNGAVVVKTETSRRSVGTASLAPGRYEFQVKAANHHGVWSTAPAVLRFMVLPYYWQTVWFRGLVVLAALAGGGGVAWRVQQNKLRRHQQQLVQERALAQEQARLASVLEATTDFVGFAAPEGQALYINPAGRRMLGLTSDEDVTRLTIADFKPRATNELHVQTAIPTAIRDGTWSGDVSLRRRDGSEFPVSQVIVAHKDAAGRLLFLSTIMRDISHQRSAQDALQESESALRAFMDALPTPALLIDRDNKFVAVNDALARSIGRRREGLIGLEAYSVLPPELAAARKAVVDRVFTSGQEISFEDSHAGRHYINYLSPVPDGHGGVARVAVFALDITQRKEAEVSRDVLLDLGTRLGAAREPVEAARIIFAAASKLWAFDAGALDIYLPESDLIQSVLALDIMEGTRGEVKVPSVIRKPSARHRRILTQGAQIILRQPPFHPPTDAIMFGDTSRPSASILNVPIRWKERPIGVLSLQSYTPNAFREEDLRTLQGLADHCGGTLERIQVNEALRESEARLHAIVHNTPNVAVQGFDLEGRVCLWNAASTRMFGWDESEAMGRRLDQMIHTPEEAAAFTRILREIAGTGKSTGPTEYRFRRRDGEEAWCLTTIFEIPGQGTESMFVCMDVDITERKRAEEQLRQAQKMEAMGQLAGGVAHDFNNILTAILGNAGLALSDTAPDHPAHHCVEEILRAGGRAKRLVQQILAFSRQQRPERRVITLAPVMDEAVSLLRATLPAGVELVTAVEAGTPSVLGDPTQMHQVLVNLCTNAWHALEGGPGRIEIKLEGVTLDAERAGRLAGLRPGRFACLSVKDTGKGMDDATLKRIFDPFFTTKEPGQGTGLGLSVVHGIVQSHDGAITVSSQPGQGASFCVFLPAVEATPVSSAAPAPPPSRGQGQHILYLDDEEALVFLARRTLERLGYRISGFTQVADALRAFREDPGSFDLVITDLNMPGTSGLRMADEFLKLRPDVPVVLCSGHVTEELKERARQAGIRDVLYKPNTMEEFSHAIQLLTTQDRRD